MIDVAIVKTSYTREGSAGKANIRYMQNRRGKDDMKLTRTLWGIDGKMERVEAYQMIDEAPKGSYFYRLILNPDPVKEDIHRDIYVWKVAEKTMRGLEERLGEQFQWVAATHDDHSPLRHVHLLAILPRKLDRTDLTEVRDMATGAALDQRRERDAILEQKKEKGRLWERERERSK